MLSKQIDDLMWYQKLGDIAKIDKVTLIGPPPANLSAQPPQDRGNPLKIRAYTFIPHEVEVGKKYPLLVFVHGGMITLMNLFNHPKSYKVGYAGVPVSDVVARMGYKTEWYRQLFSADYHIGKTAFEDVQEYRRRSPAWNAEKLETPLLIHTTTNDEDVSVLEVEHLIKSLKAYGKDFEYKIYDNAPGGHVFNRIDTKLAKESRAEIYAFLARYLAPPNWNKGA